MMNQSNSWQQRGCLGLGLLMSSMALWAEPKPVGANLPGDVLALVSFPDVLEAKKAFLADPLVRLFDDPSMKSYTEQIKKTFEEMLVLGLEKELGVNLGEYADLMQGQLSFGLFLSPIEGSPTPAVDVLLMMDSRDRTGQLTAKLKEVRARLVDGGASVKSVSIRNQSFFRLQPKGEDGQRRRPPIGVPTELYLGQVGSFLMLSSSTSILERSMAAADGGSVESLAEVPTFKRLAANRLEGAYGYGWINFAEVYQLIEPQVERMDRQFANNANMLIPKPTAVLEALGLKNLEGLAFGLKEVPQGSLVEFSMAIPAEKRSGLFKLFSLEEKDALPMPSVPADVVSFSRTRLDLGKFWSGLESMVGRLSPPVTGFVELFLGGLGKDRDPNFDFRERFFGNLGDDLITMGLPPRSMKWEDMTNPPSLTLFGSKNPEELAEALVVATGLIPSGGNALSERKFLGRTIYSFTVPGIAMGTAQPGQGPVGLFMAPADGYLVFSMDEQTIEEYLRGPKGAQSSLRRMAGLTQATEVLGEETLTSFRYDNAETTVRMFWEMGRENPEMLRQALQAALLGGGPNPLLALMDVAKLPAFDRVAKYLHYSVGGSSSDRHYINYRWFRPIPPELR